MIHLGIPARGWDLEKIDKACLERIKKICLPSLIIHGEQDWLVPLQNGREIYHHLGTQEKELLIIPSATHNDIMLVGLKEYFNAIQRFIERSDRMKEG
jgi:esterase/lipase